MGSGGLQGPQARVKARGTALWVGGVGERPSRVVLQGQSGVCTGLTIHPQVRQKEEQQGRVVPDVAAALATRAPRVPCAVHVVFYKVPHDMEEPQLRHWRERARESLASASTVSHRITPTL